MSDLLHFLELEAQPPEDFSTWYCDRPGCDGEPHGTHWHWCSHPEGDHPAHVPDCRHARAKQVPPEGDWFVWLLLAGRGLGKSRAAAEWIVHSATHQDAAEWAVVARNAADVRKNCRDMKAGIVTVAERANVLKQYNRHEEDIYLKNGAIIHAISADKPDRLRGFNLAGAWADETCLPGGALVRTEMGERPISRIRPGSRVYTRSGLRRVLWAGPTRRNAELWELSTADGSVLRCTPDHRVWTTADGWRQACQVLPGERMLMWSQPPSSSMGRPLGSSGTGSDGTAWAPRTGEATTETPEVTFSIASCGSEHTARSPQIASSTTLTTTRPTITSPTSPSSRAPSTSGYIPNERSIPTGSRLRAPTRLGSGLISCGRSGSRSPSYATTAERPSTRPGCELDSATRFAQRGTVVTASRPLPWREAVTYDLTVEGEPEFFADGLLVHNCAWRFASDTWDYGLIPALRAGEHPRVVVTTTPKPIPLIKRLVEEARVEEKKPLRKRSKIITTGSTFENSKNLAANFIEEIKTTYGGTRVGRQEIEGELLFDTSGALVTAEMIEAARIYPDRDGFAYPDFQRIVVAVDPAGSYGEQSDETGIIVCAKGRDGHGYVLADRSCKKSPHEWAAVAAAAYEQYQADAIAAEKNMGHGLVEDVIRSVAPHVKYIPIQATAGKRLRAEPVTALYEQGRIHHIGTYAKLEDQLCSWTVDDKYSPDRLDALVHGFTELGLAKWGLGHAWLDYYKKAVEDDGMNPRPLRRAGFLLGQEPPKIAEPTHCQHRWFPNADGSVNCGKCGWCNGCGHCHRCSPEILAG